MMPVRVHEMTAAKLHRQIAELEAELASQKEATSAVLDREARLRVALRAQGLSREDVDGIAYCGAPRVVEAAPSRERPYEGPSWIRRATIA